MPPVLPGSDPHDHFHSDGQCRGERQPPPIFLGVMDTRLKAGRSMRQIGGLIPGLARSGGGGAPAALCR